MKQSFEEILAHHCGPALAGIKPSNLVSLSTDSYPDLYQLIEEYSKAFNQKGIFLEVVCQCQSRCLLLIYRANRLTAQVSVPSSLQILADAGYPVDGTLMDLLSFLRSRLTNCDEFPHEIGVFLGYPPEDVTGFQKNKGKNYKLSSHWKVYSDVERARRHFLRYDKCRDAICRQLSCGMTLRQLFCPAV